MALIGTIDVLRGQLARPDHFAAAFHYLSQAFAVQGDVQARIRALSPGETQRIDLPGGAFALEQAYQSKPRSEGRFEAHRQYVDLQAIVAGEEGIEVIDVRHLELTEDRLEERDVAFFADTRGASSWRLRTGDVAVFFPVDAHMPSLALDQAKVVYKTVVKVPVPA